MFSVSTLGELPIDFTDAGTSAGSQRLDHRTAFLDKVDQETHGNFQRATLTAESIVTRGPISDPDAFTTLAFVALSPDSEREFSSTRKPGVDIRITADELARDVIADSRVFHVGSLSLTNEPARSVTLATA